MIILRQNFVDTTTQFTTSNGTTTIANLFDRDRETQWVSENAGTDATFAALRIVFDTTQTVSQIVVLNTNVSSILTYANTTSSVLASVGPLASQDVYFSFATNTTVKEVVIIMVATQVADQEKEIGEVIVSNNLYNFTSDRFPTHDAYNPRIHKKQVVHEMSDGGTATYNIKNKFHADIDLSFVPTTTFDSLKTIYDLTEPFIFIPFETTTSWNGQIAECVWPGEFDLYGFSDNNRGNGYRGTIKLRQTPGGSY